MQQDSFRNWPQGVPVRPSSPTDSSSFSSFVPAPLSTQNAQRRPQKKQSFWSMSTSPIIGREQVRGSWVPDIAESTVGTIAEFTTSPLDLALLGLAAFPLTTWAGTPLLAARAASKIPAAIRMSRAAQAAASGGRALAAPARAVARPLAGPARVAAKITDPLAGTAAALPARLGVETVANVGAGIGSEQLGQEFGMPGAIAGGLLGGVGGAVGSMQTIKGIRKGYEKALKMPSIEEHAKVRIKSAEEKLTKQQQLGKEKVTLKDYIGADPKKPEKWDINSYTLEADKEFLQKRIDAWKNSWVYKMGNKVGQTARKIAFLQDKPFTSGMLKVGSRLNPHRWYDPALYARSGAQQLEHVMEINKYTTSKLVERSNNYLFSPLKSGRHFYDPEVFGKVDMEDSIITRGLKGFGKAQVDSNPNLGKITQGPLTTTRAKNKMKKAGITNVDKLSEGRIYEEYFSTGAKGKAWRDAKVLTDDMIEHLDRLRELTKFNVELKNRIVGRNIKGKNKKLAVKFITEGDDSIIPFGASSEEIDKIIEEAIDNADSIEGMTKQQFKDLHLSKGKSYIGRHVVHRIDPKTGELEQAIRSGDRHYKIVRGTKAGFEKQRTFEWLEEGMDEGFAYLPAHQSAILNTASVMKRGAEIEVARLAEEEYLQMAKLGTTRIKVKRGTRVSEKDVYKNWDKSKRGKPTAKAVKQEKELQNILVALDEFEAAKKNDKVLKRAAEDMKVKYSDANKIIITIHDLLNKIRKNPKSFGKIKTQVEELVKLRRFYPEIDEILGENLIIKTNEDIDNLIKNVKQGIKSQYKLKDYQIKYAVKLQQARRIFGLKSKIDDIPTDKRTIAYKQWLETPEEQLFQDVAREYQTNFKNIYKTKEDLHKEIQAGNKANRGKPMSAIPSPKESKMSKDIRELYDTPEEYNAVKKLHDKLAETGWRDIEPTEVKKAIKLLDAQIRVRRGTRVSYITDDDWRKATTSLNKNVYETNSGKIMQEFDNFTDLSNVDLPALTKRLEDTVDDLVSKTNAYNERYKVLIKRKMASESGGLLTEINPNSTQFKNMLVRRPKNMTAKDQRDLDNLINDVRKLEEGYDPSEFMKKIEGLNRIQRLAALAGDSSLFGIQLVTALFSHTPVWMNAVPKFFGMLVTGLTNPDSVKYAKTAMYNTLENREIIKNSRIVLSGDPRQGAANLEFTQALEKGGAIDRFTNKAKLAPGGIGKVAVGASRFYNAFGEAFAYTMDYAGLEIRKSLEDAYTSTVGPRGARKAVALTAEDSAALDSYVDAIRGLSSSQSSGVLARQRMYESALLLAPRYRRAIFALYGLAGQSGPAGAAARRAIVNTTTGFMMVTVGLTIGLSKMGGDSEEETREKLKRVLDPSSGDFMLLDVKGQRLGIGGKLISDAKILTKTLNAVRYGLDDEKELEDYNNFITANFADNPGIKWIRGQTASAPKEFINAVIGENYIGETHWIQEEEWGAKVGGLSRVIGENLAPLWIQSGMDGGVTGVDWDTTDELTGTITRMTGDFFGLRTWPQSAGNLLQRQSFDVIGKSYSDLEPFEKKLLSHTLSKQLSDYQQRQLERTDNPMTEYFEKIKTIDEEFVRGIIALMERFPDTKEGNRDLFFTYRTLKGHRYGRRYEAGIDLEDEWANRETNDPILQAINKANELYEIEGVQIEPGVIDWDLFEEEQAKLMKTLTPEQQLAVKRNQSDFPLPAEFLRRMQTGSKKEYQKILESQTLRQQYLNSTNRTELADLSNRRFMMLDEAGNLDIEDN